MTQEANAMADSFFYSIRDYADYLDRLVSCADEALWTSLSPDGALKGNHREQLEAFEHYLQLFPRGGHELSAKDAVIVILKTSLCDLERLNAEIVERIRQEEERRRKAEEAQQEEEQCRKTEEARQEEEQRRKAEEEARQEEEQRRKAEEAWRKEERTGKVPYDIRIWTPLSMTGESLKPWEYKKAAAWFCKVLDLVVSGDMALRTADEALAVLATANRQVMGGQACWRFPDFQEIQAIVQVPWLEYVLTDMQQRIWIQHTSVTQSASVFDMRSLKRQITGREDHCALILCSPKRT
jgi:flagellar biosynthesis GTPase FlhF